MLTDIKTYLELPGVIIYKYQARENDTFYGLPLFLKTDYIF